ncbi:zinc finger protein castor homolog 1 isoform X4 [Xenopus laevis]|uniref:Zinc finger protein castor homolog 1 isoform X4 n=1 Tax=Xenopus laevis TaxID=8355 RepID=A0A8J0TBG9_XENLA|nr:zinc finger protein castor homolog 1 isoform X4 [Xenopus laevis]
MKVDYLSEYSFGLCDYAERSVCTDTTSGKPKMAAKRKGGLKLNEICAKLSRQVVSEQASDLGDGDVGPLDIREREGEQTQEGDPTDSLNSEQRSAEEDKRRREVIEKWVNGEYTDEPPERMIKDFKKIGATELPPEGIYMVQPKGCSDEEDNTEEPRISLVGKVPEERDLEKPVLKDAAEAAIKQTSGASTGETSSLRDYAANTMNEFLGMFGYVHPNVRDELAKKISFDKLNAATSEPHTAEDALSKRARFSKYEEYIRKLKAGENLSWPPQVKKCDELNPKTMQVKEGGTQQPAQQPITGRLPGLDSGIVQEMKTSVLPLSTATTSHMQGLVSRASKYDFFIQKLKTGESLKPQNGNTYKKPSKYDLENVKYLHLFKPGEGNQDMGGSIAFKTGKVGRPSKYDVRNIQKLTPLKAAAVVPSLTPASLTSNPTTPAPATEQPVTLPFNTPEYLKSTFSKTDSITTGTVSTVKNGLPPDKPPEDVNIYQKYIASNQQMILPCRFSGSQHCGHIHCAYQYREHYHCLDPECNYQRFTSKQDVIRHYNMHKKRDNSLQHGFMRFSPLDDCSVYYHGCHLNGKSTHYHCMQVGCNKVYTSTSDVMTHENFHKKNTQLINDGFQRFRATEDCGTVDCQFYGQKTTHFHCRRPGCSFTFKNKCDIEKHKSYHIKDDAYAKDGFKKFYKYEECKYEGCVYSKATNHFHCIRAGCGFTFTSTSQMTSHKRKHERRHIRSSGVLGLPSSLIGGKDNDIEESSNDDLIDFSALSSKNSSLSASPTSQQSSAPMITSGSEVPSPQTNKVTSTVPPNSKVTGLLSQTLPSNMPLALALSSSALPGAGPYFPIISGHGCTSLPVSGTNSIPVVAPDSSPQSASGASDQNSNLPAAPSIMERISASKGLISPMMARLAAAALKQSPSLEAGNGQLSGHQSLGSAGTDSTDTEVTPSQNTSQEHSLDLSLNSESNGQETVSDQLLQASLVNKSSSIPGNLLSLKADADSNDSGTVDSTHYLGKVMKALAQEKHKEHWKTYLRRFGPTDVCDPQCDFLHKLHFHCVVEECGALFSTLDGAIKHANFHFRTDVGTAKGSSDFPFSGDIISSLGPSTPPLPSTMPPGCEVPASCPAAVPSAPTLLAWKQLASSIPQIPQIPASMPSLASCPMTTSSLENAKPQVKPGFLQFQENDPCLATDCKYANKFHFHCLFGNCKYVCKTSGKAESHCLDHINPNNNLVNVRDQFAYYSLQCLCPNQHCEFRMRGHYHCLRSNCYFVTNITTKLPWHVKKHEKAERRAANGFKYFTKREECGRIGCKYNQVNSHFHCIREGCQFSFLLKHQMTSHARKHMRRMLGKNFDRVPGQVVSHGARSDNFSQVTTTASPSSIDTSFQTTPQNFLDTETDEYLDYTGAGSPDGMSSESSNMDRSCSSTPVGNESAEAGNTITMPTASGAKKRFWIIEDMSPFGKRRKTASSRKMLDEGMMLEGFRRYDLYEDCKDSACQFSLKVTHYHCTRENCGYKFCGRTHMYKHAQHHDRVDNLVLDDFKRFKSSLSCNFPDCQFSGNSTHFHCLRCGFRCTDSTKVTAHRKHHGKQDVISAAGFCQFSSSVDCEVSDCKYKLKCSHFHCTYPSCKHTVVGMSQMDSHKRKHEKQERGELPSVSPGPEGLTQTGTEYDLQNPPVNLDSSLNLSTDNHSSLLFLQNPVGVGLNDSLDLSKKPQDGPTADSRQELRDNLAGHAGDADDFLSHDEDDDDDDDDDDDEEDEEMNEDEEEDEEDLNSDSDDSLPVGKCLARKEDEENTVGAINHCDTSKIPLNLQTSP